MREGRTVYTQMHNADSHFDVKMSSVMGVWKIEYSLSAATPSESPTLVTWQYQELYWDDWLDDPDLTVTALNEKPDVCEVTISLSEEVKKDIKEPGVEGVYKADGSYHQGRPVLQHEGGFTLSVESDWWSVSSDGVGGDRYLHSRSAPSQCPADPRAARDERRDEKLWKYYSKSLDWLGRDWTDSRGISISCAKHSHSH